MGLRRIKALIGLYGLIFLSAVVQSCCEENLLITSEGYMSAWEIVESEDESSLNEIQTVSGNFFIDVSFHQKVVSAHKFSLMGSAYATTCKENILNQVEMSSLVLSIDQSFVLNEDTIPQNTNLLLLEDSGIEKNIIFGSTVRLDFTDDFFNRASLNNGDYTFSFEGRTSDNVILSSELELALAL